MPGILTNAGHLFLRDFRGWLDNRYVFGLPALGSLVTSNWTVLVLLLRRQLCSLVPSNSLAWRRTAGSLSSNTFQTMR